MDMTVIEPELAPLLDQPEGVEPGECLYCYLDRAMRRYGCRDLDLARRWNTAQPERVPNLLRWLRDHGGYCDCEVLMNVFGTGDRSGMHARLQCAGSFDELQRELARLNGI